MFLCFLAATFLTYLSFPENVYGFSRVHQSDIIRNTTQLKWSEEKSGRSFFPLVMVTVPAQPCSSPNTNNREGVCVTKKRCPTTRGTTIGPCQQGFGTCCKFTNQCTADTSRIIVAEPVENLVRGTSTGSCEYVFPQQPGICQVRLDFISLTLTDATQMGPNAGNCQSDSLTVSGAANIDGTLRVCGALSGQHMILSYGAMSDEFTVALVADMSAATYDIRATQIPCNSANKAPDDCLQYYTSSTDVVKSFGFPRQLNNQKYTICVQPTAGGSTLSWALCNDMDTTTIPANRFKVSFQPTPVNMGCTTDYIVINDQRVCGTGFETVQSSSGNPKRMHVHFDENESGNDVFFMESPLLADPADDADCATIALRPASVTFPAANRPLCVYAGVGKICRCAFSNMADTNAQTLEINLMVPVGGVPLNYMCNVTQGHTLIATAPSECSPPAAPMYCCKYFANIRITDTNDNGFCLRYLAM